MNITFNFYNPNPDSDGIRIYRSLTKILDGALPEPLAVLPGNATSYTDTTAVQGTMYHYRVGVFVEDDESLGRDFVVKGVPDSANGPGPQKLIAGDWELGLFGRVRGTDFITYASLGTFLGVTVGTAGTEYGWVKMAYKGKVLFVSVGAIRSAVPYSTLYQAGGVYGTSDDGLAVPAGATAANQYKPFNIGNWTLFPRIPKTVADGANIPSNRDARVPPATALDQNEYDDIMGVLHVAKIWAGQTNNGAFDTTDIFSYPLGINANDTPMDMCQQPNGEQPTIVPARGGRVGSVYAGPTGTTALPMPGSLLAITAQTATMVSTFFTTAGTSTIRSCWRAIIELANP